MASHLRVEASSLSLRHGVRCVTNAGVAVEDVLVDVGERVGHGNIVSASRMNKAVVVFLKDELLVNRLVESGISVSGNFIPVQPLVSPTTRVTISNVPPFIPDADIERELSRFGKFASGIKMVPLGCKNAALKHVLSFRRHVYMFLNSPNLNVSFRCVFDGKSYMVYASAGEMRCYECNSVGHVKLSCPFRNEVDSEAGPSGVSGERTNNPVLEGNNSGDAKSLNIEKGDEIGGSSQQEGQFSDDKLSSSENQNGNSSGNVQVQENVEIVNGKSVVTDGGVLQQTEAVDEITVGQMEIESKSGVESKTVSGGDFPLPKIVLGSDKEVGNEDGDDDESVQSDCSDVSNFSQITSEQVYSLEELNDFMDETFGKTVDVRNFFPDVKKFETSVLFWQKRVGEEGLSQRKRFRLKKILSKIRRGKSHAKRKFNIWPK